MNASAPIAVLAVLLTLAAGAPAQDIPLSSRLSYRDVTVTLHDGTVVRGRLVGATKGSIVVRQGGEDKVLALDLDRQIALRELGITGHDLTLQIHGFEQLRRNRQFALSGRDRHLQQHHIGPRHIHPQQVFVAAISTGCRAANLLAIQRQMEALPASQVCLFNTIASLKPIIQFDLGLDADQSGDTKLAERYFTETVRLASQDHNYHLHFISLGHLANSQTAQAHLYLARQTHEQALARQTHEQALALYTTGSASPYAALAYAGLGALHYEWNNLTASEQYLNKGLPLSRSWNHWESLIPLTLTSARRLREREHAPAAYPVLWPITAGSRD